MPSPQSSAPLLCALAGCGTSPASSTPNSNSSAPAADLQPVSAARNGFTPEQISAIRAQWKRDPIFESGDVSLYSYLHFSEFHPTARIPRTGEVLPLEYALDPQLDSLRIPTVAGEMTLAEYLANPKSRAQGMIIVHGGKIAFESYPGMLETDCHITMSVGKTTIGLVIALLEAEGKIDVNKTIGAYVPELKDTAWSEIKVINVLDMASGLDVVENRKNLDDPAAAFSRFVRAIFGLPNDAGKIELPLDVIRSATKLCPPGEQFQYSSLNSQVLVLLAEAVEHRPWSDIFESRVWSKVGAEGDLTVTIAPDGMALPVGFISIRLRDLARYGLLYTPSWNRAAREQVIPDEVVKKIQKGVRPEIYPADKRTQMSKIFGGDSPRGNSRQWDVVFDDGDFFKSGLNGQGLYVSPSKDLVIAWFSTTPWTDLPAYARAIAKLYANK